MSLSEMIPEHPQGSLRTGNLAEEVARGQVELYVTVVSPQREIYKDEAHWVTVPGLDGQFGVWPRHVPLVAALGTGVLRVGLRGHGRVEFAVRASFLSVADNIVTVLVDEAVTAEEVDAAKARRELDECVAELVRPGDDESFFRLLERRAWCQARLKLAGA